MNPASEMVSVSACRRIRQSRHGYEGQSVELRHEVSRRDFFVIFVYFHISLEGI
jgi:hypothetical protein